MQPKNVFRAHHFSVVPQPFMLPCLHLFECYVSGGAHVFPPDIVWNRASEFEKYVVAFYWSVTTITSVG